MSRLYIHEGGYTNDADDPGGPTNFGITIADARKYGREFGWVEQPTIADMRAMPRAFADKVYNAKYWAALRCDDLPAGVDDSIFDYGVNSGIGRAGKVLRRVVGLSDADWHVTPEVLAAVAKRKPADLIAAIDDERLRFLKSLKTWDDFGRGWGQRVAEVKAFSLRLAATGAIPAQVPVPVPSADVQKAGKGQVPTPPIAQKPGNVIVPAGVGGALAGWQWISAHPFEIGLCAAVVAVLVAFAVGIIKSRSAGRRDAATPGLVPVPVAA